jgi:hypothetical protein
MKVFFEGQNIFDRLGTIPQGDWCVPECKLPKTDIFKAFFYCGCCL